MEQWKTITLQHFKDYEVSDLGRVKVKQRITPQKGKWGNTINRVRTERVLQISADSQRYYKVHLRSKGLQKHIAVHRLVAEAFCKKTKGKNFVNHINGDTKDNRAANLEWCTAKENVAHAVKNGLVKKRLKQTRKNKCACGKQKLIESKQCACCYRKKLSKNKGVKNANYKHGRYVSI